jgi:glycosyltransferase involved in cell wall biosynthesis
MKVIYDSQIFAQQEFGGISRYICALASQMSHVPGVDAKIVAPLHINQYLKDADSNIVTGIYVHRLPKTARIIKAMSAALCGPISRMMHSDLVHETYYAERPLCRSNVPHVLTVYDMIEERFPESFKAGYPVAQLKKSAVNRADHIFCISENTRRDLLEIHSLPESRVSVTYLGYDALQQTGLQAQTLVGDAPYILHVAGRRGYKNFDGLLRAFAASPWLKANFRLVCFGAGALSADELGLMSGLGLSAAQVIHVGGGDERLAALYKGAAAFVYPSKYEGFGIPPLEAMSLDCPVICSSTSSIPEVVGDAGEYFDPDDLDSIRGSIEWVLQSSARRAELVALGRERCKRFTWERCAQETLAVYRRLAA